MTGAHRQKYMSFCCNHQLESTKGLQNLPATVSWLRRFSRTGRAYWILWGTSSRESAELYPTTIILHRIVIFINRKVQLNELILVALNSGQLSYPTKDYVHQATLIFFFFQHSQCPSNSAHACQKLDLICSKEEKFAIIVATASWNVGVMCNLLVCVRNRTPRCYFPLSFAVYKIRCTHPLLSTFMHWCCCGLSTPSGAVSDILPILEVEIDGRDGFSLAVRTDLTLQTYPTRKELRKQ